MKFDRKSRDTVLVLVALIVVAMCLAEPDRSDEARFRSMLNSSSMSRNVFRIDRVIGTDLSGYFRSRAQNEEMQLFASGFLSSHKLVFPEGAPPVGLLYTNMMADFGNDFWCNVGIPNSTSLVVLARASDGPALQELADRLRHRNGSDVPIETAEKEVNATDER